MRRRYLKHSLSGLALIVATILLVWIYESWGRGHHHWAYPSGWLLMGVMVLLAAYNLRKKLPFLNFGSSRFWLDMHIYTGFFSVILFLYHLRFRWPTGWFEIALAVLFAIVAVSGVIGLILSRDFPKRLTTHGGEVLYEAIPGVRLQLKKEAEGLALESVTEACSSTVADFYAAQLHWYFSRHRNFLAHCVARQGYISRLHQQMGEQDRFLNDEERKVMARLRELVIKKHGLDYQYSLQTALRMWLFVHIPFTYSLMLWSFAHVLLVYGFSAGAGGG
mgnify:CR=1 FL=1